MHPLDDTSAADDIDWTAVAGELLRTFEQPAFLVDGEARIRMVNDLFCGLLGQARPALLGLPWGELVRDPESRSVFEAETPPNRATAAIPLETGGALSTVLRVDRIGPASTGWRLVVVVHATRAVEDPNRRAGDVRYRVSLGERDRGHLVGYSGPSHVESEVLGELCFRALHGRAGPCAGCPAFDTSRAQRVVFAPADGGASFHVAEFEPRPESAEVAVVRWSVDAAHVGPLVEARVEALARDGGLEGRERDVLSLLVLGRSPKEVALSLGVSERTAKYQQAGVLRKLGATSRFDLVKLLVGGPQAPRVEPPGE